MVVHSMCEEDVRGLLGHPLALVISDGLAFAPYGSRKGSEERERAFVVAALEAGAPLAINSDAHYHGDVGSFGNAGRVARELGLNEADFVNRDAATILAHLLARRPRPGIEAGGGA
jgi:histidinol phosphatase-like PHP family hydrolase